MTHTFHIFANAALGEGLSGSDRIFIEFSKRLSKKFNIFIHVWEEGYKMCLSQNLNENKNVNFSIINVYFWCRLGFFICYIARIFFACLDAAKLRISKPQSTVIYSASEFWMDTLPAIILKIKYPQLTWVAAWFQTAPNPLIGFAQGNRENTYKLSAFSYWLMQLPIKPFIQNFADLVLVNNDLEKKQFTKLNTLNRVVVILGAVNIEEINKYQKDNKSQKIYDAVFQGRFHPQKGVVELVNIWKLVTRKKPDAQLVMIGDGPLMKNVKLKIQSEKLENNINLLGYIFDGPRKYKLFSQSKIVLHPAFYDSGGMASAEAMAFGLPAVGFDLESYESYYPQGMIKVKVGNLQEFSNVVIELLKNKSKRKKIGIEAQKMITENWSWERRVNLLLDFL